MKSTEMTCITKVILVIALAIPLQLAAQHTRYIVTDLGTLGGTFSRAGGINNRGDVVGFSTTAEDQSLRAFFWRKGVMTDLGTLGGPNSFANYRPSERGAVGASSETAIQDPLGADFCGFGNQLICLPFVWQRGVITPLPTLGGNNGVGNGMNSRGQVSGAAENSVLDATCGDPHLEVKPVIWTKGEVEELPTFPGDPDGSVQAINARGQAVGNSGNCENPNLHILLWQNGIATNLGNLGGDGPNSPDDINNQGQVVGVSGLAGNTTFHAFLWHNGVMTDLGTLPGDFASFAAGINNRGQVVGVSFDAEFNERATLWENGQAIDLNTLIPADSPLFLLEGSGTINSRGQIAGLGFQTLTGELHAFLATPTNSEVPASAARNKSRRERKVVLPENVRKMLREQLGRRYHIRGFKAKK